MVSRRFVSEFSPRSIVGYRRLDGSFYTPEEHMRCAAFIPEDAYTSTHENTGFYQCVLLVSPWHVLQYMQTLKQQGVPFSVVDLSPAHFSAWVFEGPWADLLEKMTDAEIAAEVRDAAFIAIAARLRACSLARSEKPCSARGLAHA